MSERDEFAHTGDHGRWWWRIHRYSAQSESDFGIFGDHSHQRSQVHLQTAGAVENDELDARFGQHHSQSKGGIGSDGAASACDADGYVLIRGSETNG